MSVYRLRPYRTSIIVLSLVTLALWAALYFALAWLLTTDLCCGGPVPASHTRDGYVEAFGYAVILSPGLLLLVSPVWAVTLLTHRSILKERRALEAKRSRSRMRRRTQGRRASLS